MNNLQSINEIKQCALIESSGLFDIDFYLAKYPDVAQSGMDPILHYVRHGEKEWRQPSPTFNPKDYIETYSNNENFLYQYIKSPKPLKTSTNSNKLEYKNTCKIVFSTNEKYLPFLSVAVISILENSPEDLFIEIFILYDSLSSKSIELFKKIEKNNYSYKFIKIPESYKKIIYNSYTSDHITCEAYFRLLIPNIFNSSDYILYLDSDIIALNDIYKLYSIDINKYAFAASPNLFLENEYHDRLWNSLPQKIANNYHNSGVILFNIKQFNKLELFNKCLQMLKSGYNFICHDQDILNIACHGFIKTIELKWNFQWHYLINNNHKLLTQNSFNKILNAYPSPAILHYTSGLKPINYNDNKFVHYFWKYAIKSPFFESLKTKCKYNLTSILNTITNQTPTITNYL